MEQKKRKRGKLGRRVTLIYIVTMFITMTFISTITVNQSIEGTALVYKDYVAYCVDNMAFDGDEYIQKWKENGPDAVYRLYMKNLTDFKDQYHLKATCLFVPSYDEEGMMENEVTVLYDSAERHQFGERITGLQTFEALQKAVESGAPAVYDKVIVIPPSSISVVAYAPILDAQGKTAAVVGIELDSIHVMFALLLILLVTYVVMHVFGIIPIIIVQFFIVRPIKILSRHMNEFVAEEGKLQFTPVTEVRTRDEIEQMADDFNSLAQRVMYYTENLEMKTAEEQRLRLDLDVAGQIRDLISSETAYPAFPERSDFDLCASKKHTIYNKCSFYNYFFTETDRLFIVVGESLGNNLAAMIFAILAFSSIRSFAKMGLTPYQIAVETNNQLCSTEKKDSGLTVGAVIVDIDLKTGLMRYVNAGMPPLLIKKAGESFKLERTNLPFSLGQMRGVTFEEKKLQLSQGNTVLFTSFGVSEMRDSNNSRYSMEGIVDKVNKITQRSYALNEIISRLEEDLERFRGDAPVTMDTSILGFRYFG